MAEERSDLRSGPSLSTRSFLMGNGDVWWCLTLSGFYSQRVLHRLVANVIHNVLGKVPRVGVSFRDPDSGSSDPKGPSRIGTTSNSRLWWIGKSCRL